MLTHIGNGIGYGFQDQQTAEYPCCQNERDAFSLYMTVDEKQDCEHYRRAAKGINHEKQCGDNQMPHSASGQFIQYIAYHSYSSSSFNCHLLTCSCVSVILRYREQSFISSWCVPFDTTCPLSITTIRSIS